MSWGMGGGDRIKMLCIHGWNFQRIDCKSWGGELMPLTSPDPACWPILKIFPMNCCVALQSVALILTRLHHGSVRHAGCFPWLRKACFFQRITHNSTMFSLFLAFLFSSGALCHCCVVCFLFFFKMDDWNNLALWCFGMNNFLSY